MPRTVSSLLRLPSLLAITAASLVALAARSQTEGDLHQQAGRIVENQAHASFQNQAAAPSTSQASNVTRALVPLGPPHAGVVFDSQTIASSSFPPGIIAIPRVSPPISSLRLASSNLARVERTLP